MNLHFKHKEDEKMFLTLHLTLIMIYADLANYAKEKHDIDIVITSTVSNNKIDKKLNRVSDAHQLHIALDWRTKGIDPFIVSDIINYINSKEEYKKYHYLSNSGVKRLAFWHTNGNGPHCHLQIHKKYGILKKKKKRLAFFH